jgi:hypothetical protein
MMRAAVLGPTCLALASLLIASAARGQEQDARDSRIEAAQIEAPTPNADRRGPASKAYLETARSQPAPPRPSVVQSPSDQLQRAGGNAPASQITSRDQSGAGVAQLSKADLEATLAQLSPAERRVLLQAITGTDICDNPPQVAAVIALCQTRIETRSQEFAAMEERPLSAEERLLRGDFDNTALPSITQVIERLARTSAASDDFSNQAIASIALATPNAPSQPGDDEASATAGLGEETQALVNAIINQLGGATPR